MPRPPLLAEWLATVSMPLADRQAAAGDLAEEFLAIATARGASAARRWYWWQALGSVAPNLRRRASAAVPGPYGSRRSPMHAFSQDIRFGWRMLRRRPMITLVAVGSLVVGMSLSAVVFSLFDAAVLRPLPVRDPSRLAVVLSQRTESVNHNFSYPDFVDYRANGRAFTDLLAFSPVNVTVRAPSGTVVVAAELVSGGYFDALGVRLRYGRGIVEGDFGAGAPAVAVVGEGMWRALSGGVDAPFEPREIVVNGQAFAIVGVVERRFHGMQVGRDARLWAPISRQPVLMPSGGESFVTRRGVSWLTVIGRLAPASTMVTAAADLNHVEAVLGPSVARQEKRTLLLAPGAQGDSSLPAATASPLVLLLGAALLVLVVACANVANLLVARAADRRRELALRAALGASRFRLVRLVVVEALLLGLGSAAIALGVAVWTAGLVVPWLPGAGDAVALDLGLNARLTSFVLALGLLATLLSGLAPTLGLLRHQGVTALAEGGRAASTGLAGARVRRGLVVTQFALSLGLVVAAVLLMRTLYNVRSIETGLDLDHVALLEVDPEAARLDQARIRQYYAEVEQRLMVVPGVRAASYGRVIPIGFGGSRVTLVVDGYTPRADEDMEINYNVVSPSYFDTLGIARADGRLLDVQDVLGRPLVAVVNETMARRYWPDGRAVGRTFSFGGPDGPRFEVVGVVRDVKYRALREEAGPSFYYSAAQTTRPRSGVMHVRTAGDPAALIETLRRAVAEVNPAVPVVRVRTLRDQAALNAADERLATMIGAALGGAALLLAAVGLFAAMSHTVGQRTREIGVRMALGAVPAHVRRLVLGESLWLALAGATLGLGLAFWLGRIASHRLYGVSPTDPLSFIAAALLLGGVAIAASWAPARRAARVDPIQALRTGE